MKTERIVLLGVILCFLGGLLLAGCGDRTENEQSTTGAQAPLPQIVRGGIYRVPLLNNPATLDPAYVRDEYGTTLVQQLFDGLVRFDPYLLILPALAETWQVEEAGQVYQFVLREDARFHNGSKVTATDVVFSLSRLLRVEPSPAILPHLLRIVGAKAYRDQTSETVAGLQIVDERTVRIRLAEPHAPFLTALGMYQAKVVPKAEVDRLGEKFGQQPVGSGPFQFGSWDTGRQIRLKRFPGYFADPAYLDEIAYAIYPGDERDAILSDFQDGRLEEMPVFGGARQALSLEEKIQRFHRPSLSLLFYGIRGSRPPLNDPGFRRALSLAIDRQQLVTQVYKGQFEPAWRVLPPGMPGFSPESSAQTDDPAATREDLLSSVKAKAATLPPLEIVSASQSAFAQAELSFIREAWAELGLAVNIKYIPDWPEFEAYLQSDSVQIYRYAWFADIPDPDSFLYSLFSSESPVNFMRFQSRDIDQKLLRARGISDPVERTGMYREIEDRIMESSPLLPLFYLSVDRMYRSHVQGARPSALGSAYMPLHRVWLKMNSPS